MNRRVTTPENESHWLSLRRKNLNSTEISALFDCNPYLSKFELWHQKKTQEAVPFQESERMMWGGLLEPVIAKRAAQEMKRLEMPMKDYFEIPELRIGSSFDFYTIALNGNPESRRLMEIKNVDSLIYFKNWIEDDDGDVEAPPHIEIQVQVQMLVSGFKECDLCVLVGGNELKMFKREANEAMHARILEACAEFWASIDANEPPQVDYTRDSSFLIDLYGSAADDKSLKVEEIDKKDELNEAVESYLQAADEIKKFESQKEIAKAKILEIVGDASSIKGEKYSISCGNVEPTEIKAYVRQGFRNFRITKKKQKAE